MTFKQKNKAKKKHPLFLTDNIKMNRIYTNQNFLYCVSSFEGKIQSLDLLFLVLFISFYISRYFSQVLELHSTLSENKIFITNFPYTWLMQYWHLQMARISFVDAYQTLAYQGFWHSDKIKEQNRLKRSYRTLPISLSSYVFRVHSPILLVSFFIHFVVNFYQLYE